MNKSGRSGSASGMRMGSGRTSAVAAPMAGPPGGRTVNKPSIPSNLYDEDMPAEFNSIGYYGNLNNRLDDQIKSLEESYKNSF